MIARPTKSPTTRTAFSDFLIIRHGEVCCCLVRTVLCMSGFEALLERVTTDRTTKKSSADVSIYATNATIRNPLGMEAAPIFAFFDDVALSWEVAGKMTSATMRQRQREQCTTASIIPGALHY